MEDIFYAKGLQFSCQRCSSCCRHDPGFVNLSEQDLSKLCDWASLSRENFISKYCRWVDRSDGYAYLCLLEKSNYDCILWDEGCVAYESRPFQCVSYPFWPSLVRDEDWWKANAQDCPGVGKGKKFSKEEIDDFLTKRKSEPFIRKKI